jgi:hypothetical protein
LVGYERAAVTQRVRTCGIVDTRYIDLDPMQEAKSAAGRFGLGDVLPDMPLFLSQEYRVDVPLEPTYVATWEASPEELRLAVETGFTPQDEGQ